MSPDGKYVVRLTRSATDKKKMGIEIWEMQSEK
jgi:hypothetical protein